MARERIPHALQSREYRKLLPYTNNAYILKLVPRAVRIGYRPKAEGGGGTWICRVGARDGEKERRLGIADTNLVADGKTVLTWDQALDRIVGVAAEFGVLVKRAEFMAPPDAQESIRLRQAALGAPPAEPAPETAHGSGNGAQESTDADENSTDADAISTDADAPRTPTRQRHLLSENKQALAGLSNAIRGLRSAHEALSADDPLALEIAILHFEKSHKLFRASMEVPE